MPGALGVRDRVEVLALVVTEGQSLPARLYWAMLGIVRLVDDAGTSIGTYDHYPPPDPPPDDHASLMDLLEHALGAQVASDERHRAG